MNKIILILLFAFVIAACNENELHDDVDQKNYDPIISLIDSSETRYQNVKQIDGVKYVYSLNHLFKLENNSIELLPGTPEGEIVNVFGRNQVYVSIENRNNTRPNFYSTYRYSELEGFVKINIPDSILAINAWDVGAHVFMSIDNGLLKYDPLTDSFEKQIIYDRYELPGYDYTNAFLALNDSVLLAGNHNGIYKSENMGSVWTRVSRDYIPVHEDMVKELFYVSLNEIYAITFGAISDKLWKSTDRGSSWEFESFIPGFDGHIQVRSSGIYVIHTRGLSFYDFDSKIFTDIFADGYNRLDRSVFNSPNCTFIDYNYGNTRAIKNIYFPNLDTNY